MTDLAFEARAAELSPDGVYRYKLSRIWAPDIPPALFIMLNPSTADANQDDPTIRRCIAFAKRLGHGGLLVGNLFALRSTNPARLFAVEDSRRPRQRPGTPGDARRGGGDGGGVGCRGRLPGPRRGSAPGAPRGGVSA